MRDDLVKAASHTPTPAYLARGMTRRRSLVTLGSLATLSACGGGGEPTSPPEEITVLVELSPFSTTQPFGHESDAATPAYTQSVILDAASRVTQVRWWGYHGRDSAGFTRDSFFVKLNSTAVAGTLRTEAADGQLTTYTLNLAQAFAGVTQVSVANMGADVEWYWQSAGVQGAPHAVNVAVRLMGVGSG